MNWDGWWHSMGWMWIFWVGAIVLLVRRSFLLEVRLERVRLAEEILRLRYARGEIGKEQ